jgi:histone H2B
MARGKKAGTSHPRKRRRRETWALYVYKVLKQVHPEVGVSRRAMNVMNSFMDDAFDRLCNEAA